MKKVLLLLALFCSVLFAEPSASEAINAIKANPALLDTPQAKVEMAKRGLDKGDVLQKIDSKNSADTSASNEEIVTNEIQVVDNTLVEADTIKEDTLVKNNGVKNTSSINPLKYLDNKTLLENLGKNQNTIETKKLVRFGSAFFKNKNNTDIKSLPTPDYYVLSKQDKLSIWVYGGKNENFNLVIDNNGNINLPKIGPIKVASKTFSEAKQMLTKKLEMIFPNSEVVVDIDSYSSIQLNLVGAVEAPGLYNVSSLSTLTNLLVAANGVKERGSLREVYIKRDGKVLAVVDFYRLLNDGVSSLNIILRSNDTIFVPQAKKIVSIDGAITTPAKFELKDTESLDTLISYAGGITHGASKYGIKIKRYEDHEKTKILELDMDKTKDFKLFDGDTVYVYSIDKIHKQSFYMYGNIVRPGERALADKSLHNILNQEIASKTLKGVFLENTLFDYALIKRKTADLNEEVQRVDLKEIIKGTEDFTLKNDDQIYIFNKYNSNITPYVTIKGIPVVKKGQYSFMENLTVKDLIQLAGATPYSQIKLTTYDTEDLMPQTTFVKEDYQLSPFDEVELFDYYMTNAIDTFSIKGEVNLPGQYSLNKNMTIQEAIGVAGGLTRSAFIKDVEISRYSVVDNRRVKKVLTLNLEKTEEKKSILHQDDEIIIRKIPYWSEKKYVKIVGEVKFPGTYPIEDSETIYDLLQRAGGLSDYAYAKGIVFTRERIKQQQKQEMQRSVDFLKDQASYLIVNSSSTSTGTKEASLMAMVKNIEADASKIEPIGRIVVNIDADMGNFKNSNYNITLEDKDTIIVPKLNKTISVVGEVLNPQTFIFDDLLNVKDYIQKSGGLKNSASDTIYVIKANGEAKDINQGFFLSSTVNLEYGDTIVVPMNIKLESNMDLVRAISDITYKLAITAASLSTVGAL